MPGKAHVGMDLRWHGPIETSTDGVGRDERTKDDHECADCWGSILKWNLEGLNEDREA